MTPLFSPEEVERILVDRDKGLTILELSQRYACALSTMSKLLKRHGRGGVHRGPARCILEVYMGGTRVIELARKYRTRTREINRLLGLTVYAPAKVTYTPREIWIMTARESINEVAQRTGLSRRTIHRRLRQFLEEGG